MMSNYFTFSKQLKSLKGNKHPSQTIPEYQYQPHRMVEIGNDSVQNKMYPSKKIPKNNNNACSSKNIHGNETCCKTTSQSASKLQAAVSLLLVSTWSYQVMSLFEKQNGWTSRHVKSNHPNNENSSNDLKYIKTIVPTIARASNQMLVLELKTHEGIPYISMKQLFIPSVCLRKHPPQQGWRRCFSDLWWTPSSRLGYPQVQAATHESFRSQKASRESNKYPQSCFCNEK